MPHEAGHETLPYPGTGIRAIRSPDDLKLFLLVTAFCVVLASVIVATNGSLLSTSAFFAVSIIALLTIYRVDIGFMILIAMSLLFGQFQVPGIPTFTGSISYFSNIKEISYLPSFDFGIANPFELQFLFIIAVWFARICIRNDYHVRPVALWFPACLWFTWIVSAFVNGMLRGGDFLPALWEARALMYLGVIYVFVPQVIRTKEQIAAFFWIAIACITFKAVEGIAIFIGNGWSMGTFQTLEAHEDPIFMLTLVYLLFGLIVYGGHVRQRAVLLVLILPILLGFYVGKRRAAYASMFLSFVGYLVLMPRKQLIRTARFILPGILLLAVYAVVFWNSKGGIAGPLQQIKSGMDISEGGSAEAVQDRDYLSNLYRKIEDYDLLMTIRHAPAIGIGFGTRYEQPLYLVPLNFALRDYEAHNSVVWLMVKGGMAGFFLFWVFMNCLAFRGASLFSRLNDPYLKTVCALSVVSVIILVSAAFYDLHFVWYRNAIYFGTLLGLIASIQNITRDNPGLLDDHNSPLSH
jgi:hypothetical protein